MMVHYSLLSLLIFLEARDGKSLARRGQRSIKFEFQNAAAGCVGRTRSTYALLACQTPETTHNKFGNSQFLEPLEAIKVCRNKGSPPLAVNRDPSFFSAALAGRTAPRSRSRAAQPRRAGSCRWHAPA